MQAFANVTAFITNKRNMDNYIHPAAILRMTGGKVTLTPGVDVDYVKMAEELAGCFARAKAVGGLAFTPDDHARAQENFHSPADAASYRRFGKRNVILILEDFSGEREYGLQRFRCQTRIRLKQVLCRPAVCKTIENEIDR